VHRKRRGRLPRPRLADERELLARAHAEGEAADRMDLAFLGAQAHVEIGHGE